MSNTAAATLSATLAPKESIVTKTTKAKAAPKTTKTKTAPKAAPKTKKAAAPVVVTAAVVREFYRADAKRIARLAPEAAKTVAKGARGRLHPEVIKGYNKGRKADRQYVLGSSTSVAQQHKATRAALVEKGLAGKRGRLSAEAQAALAKMA